MAMITVDEVGNVARDAVYVGVGAGVIVLQSAQAQGAELLEYAKSQSSVVHQELLKFTETAEVRATDAKTALQSFVVNNVVEPAIDLTSPIRTVVGL